MQTDGQLKTGRDVVIAALLGAEEFGFATAPLVVSGCILMRVCHLDTCPVGVATQNPTLRSRFSGKAEYVVNFFEFIAEEVRELLARAGLPVASRRPSARSRRSTPSPPSSTGRRRAWTSRRSCTRWRSRRRTSRTRTSSTPRARSTAWRSRSTSPRSSRSRLLPSSRASPCAPSCRSATSTRTVGTILGHEVTKKYGGAGLPDGTIDLTFVGSAGQSLGAFVPKGITLRLEGDANDYVGKGLSGGRIAIRPDRSATFRADEHIIAGNTIAYGATSR